jgi:hypothetical protein
MLGATLWFIGTFVVILRIWNSEKVGFSVSVVYQSAERLRNSWMLAHSLISRRE